MGTILRPPPGEEVAEETKVDEEIIVVPYDASIDPEAHRFLPFFWNSLKEDGLTEVYFPGDAETGFSRFVYLLSGGEEVLIVGKKTTKQLDIVGFASWTQLPFGQSASILAGFVFLKKYWDHKISDAAAEKIMRHWFEERKYDVALGFVSSLNRPALKFLTRNKWEQAGTIPKLHEFHGKPTDAVMFHMTRERFKENY